MGNENVFLPPDDVPTSISRHSRPLPAVFWPLPPISPPWIPSRLPARTSSRPSAGMASRQSPLQATSDPQTRIAAIVQESGAGRVPRRPQKIREPAGWLDRASRHLPDNKIEVWRRTVQGMIPPQAAVQFTRRFAAEREPLCKLFSSPRGAEATGTAWSRGQRRRLRALSTQG